MMDQYLTTREIAVEIGRTPARVRQIMHGQCTCEALPADRERASGCAGVGMLLTAGASFAAWRCLWDAHPARW
jgi:predicted transcriptional regulator